MTKHFLFIFCLVIHFGAAASMQCQSLFAKRTGLEIITAVNAEADYTLFKESIFENIENSNSWAITKALQTRKIKKHLNRLAKKGKNFDDIDLAHFVTKLEKLTLADAYVKNELTIADTPLSHKNIQIILDARKAVMVGGLKNYLQLDFEKPNSGNKKELTLYYINEILSFKYFRWFYAYVWSPYLNGPQLPEYLARRILIEGLEPHRRLIATYYPEIRTKAGYNKFVQWHHRLVILSLFTVLPYYSYNEYQEKMAAGEKIVEKMYEPVVSTTQHMAEVDQEQNSIDLITAHLVAKQEARHHRALTSEQKQKIRRIVELSRLLQKSESQQSVSNTDVLKESKK